MARRNVREAEASFRNTHWGLAGKKGPMRVRAPEPAHGTATALGRLVSVTYRTIKSGDGGPTDYEHEFGSGDGRGDCPWLAYNDTGLLILGGGYRVTYRGIVR